MFLSGSGFHFFYGIFSLKSEKIVGKCEFIKALTPLCNSSAAPSTKKVVRGMLDVK